jgi:uncharacterized membrane protein
MTNSSVNTAYKFSLAKYLLLSNADKRFSVLTTIAYFLAGKRRSGKIGVFWLEKGGAAKIGVFMPNLLSALYFFKKKTWHSWQLSIINANYVRMTHQCLLMHTSNTDLKGI